MVTRGTKSPRISEGNNQNNHEEGKDQEEGEVRIQESCKSPILDFNDDEGESDTDEHPLHKKRRQATTSQPPLAARTPSGNTTSIQGTSTSTAPRYEERDRGSPDRRPPNRKARRDSQFGRVNRETHQERPTDAHIEYVKISNEESSYRCILNKRGYWILELQHLLVNDKFPTPILNQILKWREGKPELLKPEHLHAWLNFEVEKRNEARKMDLSFACPYPKPDDVHKVRKLDGSYSSKNKLGVPTYESFYMTLDEYLDDLHYLEEIYKYFNLSQLHIDHSWVWGKYFWVKHFLRKNHKLGKSYHEICDLSRKTELSVRRILYDYVQECRKVDDYVN